MNLKFITVVCIVVMSVVACSEIKPNRDLDIQLLSSPDHKALGLPFSEAVRVGNMLYLSGQIGVKPGGLDLIPGGVQAETRQILQNIGELLNRHGSALTRVVKCTIFLADMSEWQAMNKVYIEMFAGHLPARSAVGGSAIALGGRVEIECIAALN